MDTNSIVSISAGHTAFYTIREDDGTVRVHEITDIDDAHKRYGH